MSLRLKKTERPILYEPLGRNIEKIEPARRELPLTYPGCCDPASIQEGYVDVKIAQRVHLILHQRDKRRYDNAVPDDQCRM